MNDTNETKERANPFHNLPAIGGGSRLSAGPDTILNLGSMAEVWRFAEIISTSPLVPKDFQSRPASVLLAIEWGVELGIPPLQALQNIAVINGKPSIYGELGMALVQQRAGIDLVRFETSYDSDKKIARVVIERKNPSGDSITADESFSWQDAVAAGLAGKDTYKSYPNNMLTWRAFWRAAKRTYSDLLRGMPGREELEAVEDMRPATVTVSDAPPPARKTDALLESMKPMEEAKPGFEPDAEPAPADPTEDAGSASETEPDQSEPEPESPERQSGDRSSDRQRTDLEVSAELAKLDEMLDLDRECHWAFGKPYAELSDASAIEVMETLKAGKRVANIGLRTRADVAKEIGRVSAMAGLETADLKELAAEKGIAWTGEVLTKCKNDVLAALLDAVREHSEMVGE